MNKKKKNPTILSPRFSLVISFFILILVGAILLSLPISSAGVHNSFLDALFTATSATCVTGLIVVDTTTWSLFGQLVILLLIQVGGLGIMTFSSFVILLFSRRLSLWEKDLIEHSFAGSETISLKHVLWAVVLSTLFFESIGAVIMSIRFSADYTFLRAVYLGVFHSVSAFCNAGFSLFSTNLVQYRGDPAINFTAISLVILGGLGFWVLYDLKNIVKHKRNVHSTTLHTRLVIIVTTSLIGAGFVIFLLTEWHAALNSMPVTEKVYAALFQSVSARTAGFNTLDIGTLGNSSHFFLLILMLIGASPGSCGGGIKTTTFAIVLAMIYARMKNQKQVRLLKRGIAERTVAKAIGVTASAIIVISVFCFILLVTESPTHPGIPEHTLFIEVLFEVVSAIGTVGLSMGLTPALTPFGKVCIILLMYIGRIGPITLTLALTGIHQKNIRYAEENVWLG